MELKFSKYHGVGNDFVLIDARAVDVALFVDSLTKEQIAAICHRRFGVGADGVMFLESAPSGFDFRMRYFNSDGGHSTMCGNGGRCIVRFADDLGIGGVDKRFVAVDGEHLASVGVDGRVSLQMIDVGVVHKVSEGWFVDTGSPHLVLVDDAYDFADARRLRQLYDANVNYVSATERGVEIRTYERGVEDETWACGTGATAVAIVMAQLQGGDGFFDERFIVRGGELSVSFKRVGSNHTDVVLRGGATKVFDGVWSV